MVCWCDDEMLPTLCKSYHLSQNWVGNRDDAGPSFSTHLKVDLILTHCLKRKRHPKYTVQTNFLQMVYLL
jgi:hypothetical protein